MSLPLPTSLVRLLALALVLCLVGTQGLFGAEADAQASARRPVRAGAVTGVEMQIEGAMSAPRGGTLSFAVTAYDVVGLSELRPSPHATIRALSSLAPAEAAAEVHADANGRALISIPVPVDAPANFAVMLELRSRARALRRFELGIQVTAAQRLSLRAAPSTTRAGSRVVLHGRLESAQDGRGVAGREVRVSVRDQRGPLRPDVTLRTNDVGLFELPLRVPDDVQGALQLQASTLPHGDAGEPTVAQSVNVPMSAVASPSLLVFASVERRIVTPGASVAVEVVVRRPDGRPVPHAQVVLNGSRREQDIRSTDSRGRVQLMMTAPRSSATRMLPIRVGASRAGFGRADTQVSVLVTTQTLGARVSFEGGALSPELGGDVLVQVGRTDGLAASEVPVNLRLADGRSASGETDSDGAAALTLPHNLHAGDGSDGCGGGAATRATLEVGSPVAYRHDLCVPLDPDATNHLRLVHYRVAAGESLELQIERIRAAARLPLVLTAFRMSGGVLRPFATQVLPPSARTATLEAPAGYAGRVLIRVRALYGRQHVEVRGSTLVASIAPSPSVVRWQAEAGQSGRARFTVHAPEGTFARVSVLPLAQARALYAASRGADTLAHGELYVRAELARMTPLDRTAPAVLRNGRASAMPSVAAPETAGVLRDPWRAQARFTEGRLGLIFRALESRLAAAVPGDIDSVAVRERGRLRLNDRVLESLGEDGQLGAEGATGLGGEPLRLETLRRLDRDFGYDAVARRLTRRRLFRVLIGMRQFVRERDFDLPWARLGEPELWLRNMAEQGMELPDGDTLEAREFVDGWGHAFALRRSTRGGPLAPIPGYAVVSAGPDGRFGTGDDLMDPTARVLRSGGLYAEAVGEATLLARLSGVEVARATLRSVAQLFSMQQPTVRLQDGEAPQAQLDSGALPTTAPAEDPFALALVRPRDPIGLIQHEALRVGSSERTVEVRPGDVPRPIGAVLETFDASGSHHILLAEARLGGELLADAVLAERLRVDEPVRARVHLTNLGLNPLTVHALLEAQGLSAEAPSNMTVPGGETRDLTVEMRASDPGRASLALAITAGGTELSLDHALEVITGVLPLQIAATEMTREDGLEFRLEPPDDARSIRARLVLVSPGALYRDPALAELRQHSLGLYAFSVAMSGESLSRRLRSRLLRAEQGGLIAGRDPRLGTAAALVALGGALDDDDALNAASRMTAQLAGQLGSADAATVAALATRGVTGSVAEAGASDPLTRALTSALPQLRRALRQQPENAGVLARASAALLLADPTDLHGLSMLEILKGKLASSGYGQLLTLEDDAAHAEQAAATFALSVAAWQSGDRELADELVRGAMRYQRELLGGTDEQIFWLLASAGYGAMGVPAEAAVRVEVDGESQELGLEHGARSLDIDVRAGHSTEVNIEGDAGLLARLEASYDRTPGARTGALSLSLRGDAAALEERGLFELTVHAEHAVAAPMVEFTLPAGADLDDTLRRALEGNSVVSSVEQREGGVVRLVLRGLSAGQNASLPLPLLFLASGDQRGLGMLAFPAEEPASLTVLPARTIHVTEAAAQE